MSPRNEFSMFIEPEQRENVLRGILRNFYDSKTSTPIVFDTNRAWCTRIGAIAQLLPSSRMICCVRNVAWIVDSFERLVQINPLHESRTFSSKAVPNGASQGITVYARGELLMEKGGIVRVPLDALREAYYGQYAERIMLVRYESLARNPVTTMDAIYDFIGEERFPHDFDNVEFSAEEYDQQAGLPGLHTVRRKVEFRARGMIIPPDIAARFNIEFWNDVKQNLREVRIV